MKTGVKGFNSHSAKESLLKHRRGRRGGGQLEERLNILYQSMYVTGLGHALLV